MRIFLNDRNCKRYTGHSKLELLKLSGIIGLHPFFDESIAERAAVIWTFNHVEIEIINTDIIAELLVEIYLKQKTILNKSIIKQKGAENVGALRLKSQVENAYLLNYKEIYLEAYGADNNQKYFGYKTWAKHGFEMSSESQKVFQLGLNYYNSSRNLNVQAENLLTLQRLPNGKAIWEIIAFDWMGIFTIEKNSNSILILNELLKELNITELEL